MASDLSSSDSAPHLDQGGSDFWQRLESLLADIDQLGRSDCGPATFYGTLVNRVSGCLVTAGVRVYLAGPDGETLECLTASNDSIARLAPQETTLAEVFRAEEPSTCAEKGSNEVAQATHFLSPIRLGGEPFGVLSVTREGSPTAAVEQSMRRVLRAVSGLIADFESREVVRRAQSQPLAWEELDRLLAGLHQSLSVDQTAFVLVNEVARLLKCDRVSLLLGARHRVRAISGVDLLDRRSAEVLALQRLVRVTSRPGEDIWFTSEHSELPPELETALEAYLDVASSRCVAVIPVFRKPDAQEDNAEQKRELLGTLVLERFQQLPFSESDKRLTGGICRHAGLALSAALTYEGVPFRRVGRMLSRTCQTFVGSRWFLAWSGLSLAVACLAALIWIPADFSIHCRGELQPAVRRNVFSPENAEIDGLLVTHGQRVERGEPLIRLKSSELDYEFSRLEGEMETNRKHLASVTAAAANAATRRETDPLEYDRLIADKERISAVLESFEAQRQVLQRRRDALLVASPITGRIQTWDTERMLEYRPVRQGQKLLTVFDPDQEWVLELHVEDYDMGHVLAARAAEEADQKVRFLLFTNPNQAFEAEVQQIGVATTLAETDAPYVLVTARLDKSQLPRLRPGAGVSARIDCGRKSLGFVLLRDIIEVIQTRFFF